MTMMKTGSLGYFTECKLTIWIKIFVSEHTEETFKCFIDILHRFDMIIFPHELYFVNWLFSGGDDLWILYIEFYFSRPHFYMRIRKLLLFFPFSSLCCSVSIFFWRKSWKSIIIDGLKLLAVKPCCLCVEVEEKHFFFGNRKTLFW